MNDTNKSAQSEALVAFVTQLITEDKIILKNNTSILRFKGGITGFERYSFERKTPAVPGTNPLTDRFMTEIYVDFCRLIDDSLIKNVQFFNIMDLIKFEAKGEIAKALNSLVSQHEIKSASR